MAAHFTAPIIGLKQTFMSKFKVGDLVYWSGNHPTLGVVVTSKPDSFFDDMYEYRLDVYGCTTSHTSCSEVNLRLATPEEREKYYGKKELTSLPEKWCIKNSFNLPKEVGAWFKKNIGRVPHDPANCSMWHYPETSRGVSSCSEVESGYTEITFDQFKKWVLGEQTEVKSAYGLNIGDTVDEEDLTEWCRVGDNWSCKGSWKKYHFGLHGDRKVLGFKGIQGKVGFQVTCTSPDVYFRAEGFKDFVAKRNTVASEPDKKEDSKQNLLGEAKRRFPVGTKVRGLHLKKEVVIGTGVFDLDFTGDKCIRHMGSNGNYDALYDAGREPHQWAEIISKPNEASNEVPEYVECISDSMVGCSRGEILKCREVHGVFEWRYNKTSGMYKGEDHYDRWTNTGWTNKISQETFKPSTKEAFEAQNKKEKDFPVISISNGRTGSSYWAEMWKVYPSYDARLTKEILPTPQPSSKVSVKVNKEINIKVNKPKQINLWQK